MGPRHLSQVDDSGDLLPVPGQRLQDPGTGQDLPADHPSAGPRHRWFIHRLCCHDRQVSLGRHTGQSHPVLAQDRPAQIVFIPTSLASTQTQQKSRGCFRAHVVVLHTRYTAGPEAGEEVSGQARSVHNPSTTNTQWSGLSHLEVPAGDLTLPSPGLTQVDVIGHPLVQPCFLDGPVVQGPEGGVTHCCPHVGQRL